MLPGLRCRQQHLLATSQLQNIAKLLEDAAAGRYKRAVDTASAAAAAAASSGADADQQSAPAGGPASDSKQLVLAELGKASNKQAKLVELLQDLQQQTPGLHDELQRVLLHAAATSAWLQPQTAAAVH